MLSSLLNASGRHSEFPTVITTRRSLLASLGLALPVVVTATAASATSVAGRSHHAKAHSHAAHTTHHGKTHHAAAGHSHTKRT
jgi:hypothetical protein